MKHLFNASIRFLIPLRAFAYERQRQIEYKAINLVNKKYGKGLENRLKGTELNPNNPGWYENDFFVSVAVGIRVHTKRVIGPQWSGLVLMSVLIMLK